MKKPKIQVILSQIFRGFAKGLAQKKFVTAAGLSGAFNAAVRQAYQAVVKPVEGTILTVLREAVQQAGKNIFVSIYQYLVNLLNQARITLAKTKEILDVLKEANVVDSGGAGLVYILEGFVFMPRYKRPRKIIFASVPRNPTGKIEKPKLREIYCGFNLVERETTK